MARFHHKLANGFGMSMNIVLAGLFSTAVLGKDMRWTVIDHVMTDSPEERCFNAGHLVSEESGVLDCHSAAESGELEAQFTLAERYYFGDGVVQDYRLAMHWYERAAMRGHTEAQHNLAHMYRVGQGVDQNLVMAKAWYDIFAEFHDAGGGFYPERDEVDGLLDGIQRLEAEFHRQEIASVINTNTGWNAQTQAESASASRTSEGSR